MLKRRISAQEYSALPEAVQAEYVAKDGGFVVSLEGEDPDLVEYRRQLQAEKADRIKAQTEAAEQLKAREALEAKVASDIETATATTNAQREKAVALLIQREQEALIGSVAEHFTAKDLIVPALKSRITVGYDPETGTLAPKILAADGVTETTIDAVRTEYLQRKDLSGILVKKPSLGTMDVQPSGKPPAAAGAEGTEIDYSSGNRSAAIAHLAAKFPATKQEG